MKKPGRNTRLFALLIVLCLLLGVWGASHLRARALARDAAPLAEQHMEEYRTDAVETASMITVSRSYLLFGEPTAKVEVYLREEGSEKPPAQGIQYYYVRQNGEWRLQESAGCTGEECRVRGVMAFDQS